MLRHLLHAAHAFMLQPARLRFQRAIRHAESIQASKLQNILRRHAGTEFGREMGFESITSVESYQDRVPLADYSTLQPYIAKAAAGESLVLTSEPILCFEQSSGSTSGEKLIPYTRSLLQEFAAATQPWMANVYSRHRGCFGKTSYWSISPAARIKQSTLGGIPIGLEDDTQYFGAWEQWALRRMQAVDPTLARVEDMEIWRRKTLQALLEAEDLGFISVWHPSFFSLLMDAIESEWELCLAGISPKRAAQLRERRAHEPLGKALWPHLSLVSCWGHGPARNAYEALKKRLPHASFQTKGLLATEGVVTLPWDEGGGERHVAAIDSHFLEFDDLQHPQQRPRMAHQLEVGAEYAPRLTTGGGLYRYRLGDALRCTGFLGTTPVLEFLGRCDQVVDMCGEKLHALQVAEAIDATQVQMGCRFEFALLAPIADGVPGYRFFVEGIPEYRLEEAERVLEHHLQESHGYRYARKLGQLNTLRAMAVQGGRERYVLAKARQGKRLGQIKPTHLEMPGPWIEWLADGKN